MTLFPDLVTHEMMVEQARAWLKKTRKCSIVVSEIAAAGMESPDAIGWKGHHSHLVECKISRSDFLADQKKSFRRDLARGLGDYRWYLTLPGNIKDESELPKGFGWLIYDQGKIRTMRKAEYQHEKYTICETYILLSLIKRIGQSAPAGCSIRCYTYETKNRTVLEVGN